MSVSDAAPLISLRHVGLTYANPLARFKLGKARHIQGLTDVSFEVFEGDKLGIIGRNGSGKSTLMRILAGVYAPDRGTVRFSRTLHVQMLSLGVGFEGSLTGRENAVLNGLLLGKTRRHMLARLEIIKEFSGLGPFFEMAVATYSSGMVLRLGFSIAIETDPDLLLIDEVLSVGDASFARKSQEAIEERFASHRTMVMISHDPQVITRLCNRAVLIEAGRSVLFGSPAEVSAAYLKSMAGG